MAGKKFYWLKLKRDFFKRHDIRIIEAMPNGKDYILFYLKMLLESIDHEGELRFSDAIPYNEQMLAVITNTNIDIVKAAMKLFIDLRMVDVMDDQTIYMMEVEKLIGSESESAARMRKHRANARSSLCDANVQKSDTEIEKELEEEIEPEEEIEDTPPYPPLAPEKPAPAFHKYGEYGWVKLTDEQYQRLLTEWGEAELKRCIKYVDESAQSSKNKNKWTDWNLVVRRCHRDGWGIKKKKSSGNVFKDMLEEEMYG